MQLTDLPVDILFLLFPYLEAGDFLSLVSCHPNLLSFCQEPTYWRHLTRSTFRLPPQPLLEADGAHWQRLYKNLRTQTNVYTWGSNSRGNLGHFRPPHDRPFHDRTRRMMRLRATSGWPKEMMNLEHVGVVADVQCGGWSTVLLNATGQLWAVGALNGMTESRSDISVLTKLKFPDAYTPTSTQRYEPSTAVREFSIGRWRALALSDDHKIWEWTKFSDPAQLVKFFTLDTDSRHSKYGDGKVTLVRAGWSLSSAYVIGAGIAYWKNQPTFDATADTDGCILTHDIVPGTAYRQDRPQAVAEDSIDASVGEVIDYIVLDGYIVFMTHKYTLYAWSTNQEQPYQHLMELTSFYNDAEPKVQSIQGSFIKFGVFTKNGTVLIGTKDFLDAAWTAHVSSQESDEAPVAPQALQNCGVVSLAFGDYHFQALHADGSITSYGTESQGCGSLGLGEHSVSHLRGVTFARRGDGVLKTPPWGDGRRTVWFEHEKQRWLDDTCQKGATNEARERASNVASNVEMTKAMGEYFERGGRDWSAGPYGNERDEDDDGIAPYFALKISAAGHSTATLVLVNREKAERIRKKYLIKPTFGPVEEQRVPLTTPILPAPRAQSLLESVATSITTPALSLGRSFLGLTNRDETLAPEADQGPAEASPAQDEAERRRQEDHIRYNSVYVWEEEPFPRLRLPDGTVMVGEVPLTSWKGGEPDFRVGEEGA